MDIVCNPKTPKQTRKGLNKIYVLLSKRKIPQIVLFQSYLQIIYYKNHPLNLQQQKKIILNKIMLSSDR